MEGGTETDRHRCAATAQHLAEDTEQGMPAAVPRESCPARDARGRALGKAPGFGSPRQPVPRGCCLQSPDRCPAAAVRSR